ARGRSVAPFGQEAASPEIEDDSPRRGLVVARDRHQSSPTIERAGVERKPHRQAPDHPTLEPIPDGDVALGRGDEKALTVGMESRQPPNRHRAERLTTVEKPYLQ